MSIHAFDENKNKADIFPVGSIYMSVNNTNPSEYFNGTWEAWGSGRVPVGVGTASDSNGTSETFDAGETGGEYTHRLTIGELANHAHIFSSPTHQGVDYCEGDNESTRMSTYVSDGASNTTSYVGGNQYHNNLQPYITCYMWRRTA